MQPVTFDYDKCTGDGICAEICPRKLIAFDEKSSRPSPISEASELCIRCGHCLAVCPSGAVALDGLDADSCPRIDKALQPGFDPLDLLLKSRRSIRVYKNKPVDEKTIDRLLETCRYAPSGSNTQPVNWILVSGKKRLKDLAQQVIDWMQHAVDTRHPAALRLRLDVVVAGWKRGEDRIFRGAPMAILTHAPEIGSLPSENCVIAMTYFDLAATTLGLGTCWIGYLMLAAAQHPPIRASLEIPDDHRLFGAMAVGYPKYVYQRIPPRNQPAVRRYL